MSLFDRGSIGLSIFSALQTRRSGCVFFPSLLGLFNRAELKDAARIMLRRDGPPLGTVSQEALEVRFSRRGGLRLVHFFNRTELLNQHIIPHRSN